MAAFAQPPTDPKVNTYATLDQANAFLARRLYTEAWDNASESPGARDYVVDGAHSPGDTVITIKDGQGDWTVGSRLTFVDPGPGVPVYTVTLAATEPVASITIATPGLVAPIPGDGSPVYRQTPNEKESALIWSACILDGSWDWFGSQRYASRGTVATSSPQQNLRWPRSGVQDRGGYTFIAEQYPEPLINLCAEQALYLLQRDNSAMPDVLGLGFSKAEIPGPLKVEVDRTAVLGMTPDYLWNKYRELGIATAGANPGTMSFQRMRRA